MPIHGETTPEIIAFDDHLSFNEPAVKIPWPGKVVYDEEKHQYHFIPEALQFKLHPGDIQEPEEKFECKYQAKNE